VVARPSDVAALVEPAEVVRDGHRTGELRPDGIGQALDQRDVVLGLDAAPERHDALGVVETGRLGECLAAQDGHRGRLEVQPFDG